MLVACHGEASGPSGPVVASLVLMVPVTNGAAIAHGYHALRTLESPRRVLALVDRSAGVGLPALPVLRRPGPALAGLPISAAIATMEAMEASVGRVGRRPSLRQVQVALVAGLVAVRPPDAAAKVAISTTCHGERSGQACTVLVPYVGVAACKDASVLASIISCLESEADVSESGRRKMAMGLLAGSSAESPRMAAQRPSPSRARL